MEKSFTDRRKEDREYKKPGQTDRGREAKRQGERERGKEIQTDRQKREIKKERLIDRDSGKNI